MNRQFLIWVHEVRDAYLREYVMAGGDLTGARAAREGYSPGRQRNLKLLG